MELAADLLLAFVSGLLTPLGAVCVLPLYPAYLAFLARGSGTRRPGLPPLATAFLATLGVISAMALAGFIVTVVFRTSFGAFLATVSPWLFLLLLAAGLLLLAGKVPSLPSLSLLPRIGGPAEAFLFGAFFGVISLPCNPGPVLLLFSIAVATGTSLSQLPVFLSFGIGMCFPLIVLAAVPSAGGQRATSWLARNRRGIEVVTGALMVIVALFSLLIR